MELPERYKKNPERYDAVKKNFAWFAETYKVIEQLKGSVAVGYLPVLFPLQKLVGSPLYDHQDFWRAEGRLIVTLQPYAESLNLTENAFYDELKEILANRWEIELSAKSFWYPEETLLFILSHKLSQ